MNRRDWERRERMERLSTRLGWLVAAWIAAGMLALGVWASQWGMLR